MTNTGSIVQYLINQDEQLKYTYNTVHTLRYALKESNFTEFEATIAYARTRPIHKGLKRVLRTFSKLSIFIQSTFSYSKFTNGPIEGINNKIKVLKRTAYGYRNYSHFKDRILLISRLYISGKKKEDIKQQTVA